MERYSIRDGEWYDRGYATPYFGTDLNGTKVAKQKLIDIENQIEVLNKKQRDLFSTLYDKVDDPKKRAKYMKQVRSTREYKELTNQIFELYDQQVGDWLYDLAMSDAQKFLDDNSDKFIAILKYCDNDGNIGSVLEHGDTFDDVKHIRTNHH